MKLTGGEIIAEYLIKEGVPYVIGIPGHGCLGLVDAFKDRQDRLKIIQVKHEQCAVHMADGYYRVTGKPLAVFTSIGPGAINTAVGVATSYVDSTAVLVLTGDVHTHMFGRGVLQEIERKRWADFPRVLEPVVKRFWQITRVDQLPGALRGAFSQMYGGRPGPVLIDLPMDVQSDPADVELVGASTLREAGRVQGDPAQIERAARLLVDAKRPVILAGGGVVTSEACAELRETAEFLGAAVVTTMMGKGCFPENHPLYGWHTGSKGTACGNALTREADVILAVGCRFADETCSSYKPGASFSMPPTRLIHIDIDPQEISKNYPAEVGIVGDARSALAGILSLLKEASRPRDYKNTPYFEDIQRLKNDWFSKVARFRDSDMVPPTISRCLKEVREVLDDDAIVVSSSGNAQAQLLQEFPFYKPRTNITTGGFSTMGFTLPAALGAKLAAPDKQVVGLIGDGDFLMTIQELSTAVEYDLPVVMVVLNNIGWQAIKDLQIAAFGEDRAVATDFVMRNGELHSTDFVAVARGFGAYSERVERPEGVKPALKRALKTGLPSVVEVMVNREYPYSGGLVTGWWDVPVPAYLAEKRESYVKRREKERLV